MTRRARRTDPDLNTPVGDAAPAAAFADGDFDAFYRAHYRDLVGLGVVLTGDRGTAEDLAQETFSKVHVRWQQLMGYDDPLAWARRVLANAATSRGRRITNERRVMQRLRARRTPQLEIPEVDQALWTRVRALPARQAQAIALHYWNDLTIAQIAGVLDIGEESVKTHLTRGRQRIRLELTDDNPTAPGGDA